MCSAKSSRCNFNPRPSQEGRRKKRSKERRFRISIHVPHRRDDDYQSRASGRHRISIHVPHRRDDIIVYNNSSKLVLFQSTSLTGGTTKQIEFKVYEPKISIHVPHRRDDGTVSKGRQITTNFNPRPSQEGRHARKTAHSWNR